jgi:hypothetical protein
MQHEANRTRTATGTWNTNTNNQSNRVDFAVWSSVLPVSVVSATFHVPLVAVAFKTQTHGFKFKFKCYYVMHMHMQKSTSIIWPGVLWCINIYTSSAFAAVVHVFTARLPRKVKANCGLWFSNTCTCIGRYSLSSVCNMHHKPIPRLGVERPNLVQDALANSAIFLLPLKLSSCAESERFRSHTFIQWTFRKKL